jgi:lipopolysaccharide/colanic/teichoic acid biosynthesis glycosyltransferase
MKIYFARSYQLFPIIVFFHLIIAFVPGLIVAPIVDYQTFLTSNSITNAMLINTVVLILSITAHNAFESHPQVNPVAYVVPVTSTLYSLSFLILLFFRIEYSLKVLAFGILLAPIFLFSLIFMRSKHKSLKFLVVPFGDSQTIFDNENFKFVKLNKPIIPNSFFNGVIVDLHSKGLSSEWVRFIAKCALSRIHVYNLIQLRENMTGKVDVAQLVENNFGDLIPSRALINAKQLFDILFLIIISPIIITLMIFIALWIKFDSPGGVFFIQERLGYNKDKINIIKFRTMFVNHYGAKFTSADNDSRITNAGKFLRKYRLDEIPQFWNVIKGEMSLIGPRPECAELSKSYEQDVPFFDYRHVVKPGISGWAQVMHGYAAGVEEMNDKLAYDFYYIKHFSVWLDLLILYKTIRTVLTGFGSR